MFGRGQRGGELLFGGEMPAVIPGAEQIIPGDILSRTGGGGKPRRKKIAVVAGVLQKRQSQLLEIVHAVAPARGRTRLVQGRKQHRRQNCDDGDYDQQFN